MTRKTRPAVSNAMLRRLREQAENHSNFVEVILFTAGIGGRYGGIDGRDTLIEILSRLLVLTGSEQGAIDWLFNSRGYKAIVNSDICENIACGGFWTLMTIRDWLHVIEASRDVCPEFIEAVFRG